MSRPRTGDQAAEETVRLELDPASAAQRHQQRSVRFHTVEVPALRLAGFLILLGVVGLYGRFLLGASDWGPFGAFAAASLVYCLGSWALLRLYYSPNRRLDLGLLFLNLDVVLYMLAIYLTGGEDSGLIFLLLVRVADQANTTFRRTAYFVHLGVALYLVMLAYLVWVEGHSVSRIGELAKLSILYATGMYVALTARTAERLRARTSAAIAVARQSFRDLEVKSRELMRSRRTAEEASRFKGQILATVSHELLTPLNGMRSMIELTLDTTVDAEQRDYLETARASALDLERLVGQVIEFSHLDEPAPASTAVAFSPRECLTEALRKITPAAAQKGLDLQMKVDEKVPAVLVGDPAALRHVLELLLDNAVKFTVRGSIRLSASSEIRTAEAARVRFSVADTGIGISPEQQTAIFEPFRQGDASSTRRYGGLGLGLATAARLTERMRGYLWVDSEEGVGSTFHLAAEFGRATSAPQANASDAPSIDAEGPTQEVSDERHPGSPRPAFAIDFDRALARLGGDEGLLREVAILLREEWKEQSAAVGAALDQGDLDLASRALHSVKGSLAVFTLGEIYQATQRLEVLAKTGPLEAIRSGWRDLAPRLETFVGNVARWAESPPTGDQAPPHVGSIE